MPNPYTTDEGREDFRREFPANSRVIPLDILSRAHMMLRAVEEKESEVSSFDREVRHLLVQATEHPMQFATSHDGLYSLFYLGLHMRGMFHGDSGIWRDALRKIHSGHDMLHRRHSQDSLEDFAKVLRTWVDAFDTILLERKG